MGRKNQMIYNFQQFEAIISFSDLILVIII